MINGEKINLVYKHKPKRYIYQKYFFELKGEKWGIPLNMDGSPKKVISDPFYDTFKEWLHLPNKEDYRVIGG